MNKETAKIEQPPQSRRRKVSKRTKLGFALGILFSADKKRQPLVFVN